MGELTVAPRTEMFSKVRLARRAEVATSLGGRNERYLSTIDGHVRSAHSAI